MAEESLETMVRRLTGMMYAQHEANQRQADVNAGHAAMLEELRAFNRQQVEINAGVQTTLARIETLLAHMLRQEGNGRDA